MPFLCAGVEWKKVKTLGKGSFGEAHLITAVKDPQRQAVVKLVNLSSMSSNERRDANNEVVVLSKLRHPNIVGFIGSFEADGHLNIVMEYCNAGDVEALVKKQGSKLLPEETVASLFIQTAHALRYMHAKKIMHRDLKSQNIFLHRKSPETPYIAKLGDFGISTMLKNTLAMAKTVCGTPYYFSPELCLNRPYNNKSDIWSLGIILYELAALKHAFDASSMKGLMQRILQGKYDAVPKVYHKSLGELLQYMLHQKVDRRFDISKVLASDFVKQHSERMQIAHDLSKTQRMGGDELLGGGGGRGDINKVVDPRFMAPLSNAQNGIANAGKSKGYDDRDSRAMLNRLAADKDRDQKKMVLEDQRRRRRIEAARNYDRHREGRALQVQRLETDRLDDIRRRVEICSWEDQQKYIDEGWKFVQETKQKQDQRQRHQYDTDRQLMDVRSQMKAIEAKMKERRAARGGQPPSSDNHSLSPPLPKEGGGRYAFVNPPQSRPQREPTAAELAKQYRQRVSKDAPWNRNREYPIGFTKDTWEAYQHANPNDKGGIVVDGNQVPVPRPKEPLDLKKLRMLGTARVLTDYDIDALLDEEEGTVADELMKYDPEHKARMDNILSEKAKLQGAQEWELHKRRIEQAKHKRESASPSSSSPPAPVRQYLPLEARIRVESDGDEDASYDDDDDDEEQVLTSTPEDESGETDDDDDDNVSDEDEEGFSGPDDHLPVEERRRPSIPASSSPGRDDAPLNVIYRSRDQPETKPQASTPKTKQTTSTNKSKPQSSNSQKAHHNVHPTSQHNVDVGYSSGVFDETFEEVISAMRQQEVMPPLPETFGDDGWDNSNEEEEMMFRKMYGLPPVPTSIDDEPPSVPSAPQPPTSKRPASGSPGRTPQQQQPTYDHPQEDPPHPHGDDTDDFRPQTSQITEDTISQFTLDGRPLLLPGVTPSSSLKFKTDALHKYLEEALGGKRSFKKLYESLVSIQGAEVGEEDANAMVVNLEKQYGERKVFVDLMMQLMVCEGVLQQQ